MGKRIRSRLWASAIVSVLVVVPQPAAPQSAEGRYFINVGGQRGSWLLGGIHLGLHKDNSSLTVIVRPDEQIDLSLTTAEDRNLEISFAPPPGESLEERTYRWARTFNDGTPYAHFAMYYSGRGCSTFPAYFRIKDISFSPDGDLERLWMIFEQHCDEPTAAFGEVRIGIPSTHLLGPRLLRAPTGEVTSPRTGMIARFVAEKSIDIDNAKVVGPESEAFVLKEHNCTANPLLVGDMCLAKIKARYGPPGRKRATLLLSNNDVIVHRTKLRSLTVRGRTRFVLDGDRGEQISRGRYWRYIPGNAYIYGSANAKGASGRLYGHGPLGDFWEWTMEAPVGEKIVAGRRYRAVRYQWHDEDTAGLTIAGEGRACDKSVGRFVFRKLKYAHDLPRRVRVVFKQRCKGERAWLYGVFDYRMKTKPPDPRAVFNG